MITLDFNLPINAEEFRRFFRPIVSWRVPQEGDWICCFGNQEMSVRPSHGRVHTYGPQMVVRPHGDVKIYADSSFGTLREGYIARDEDGRWWWYKDKPELDTVCGVWFPSSSSAIANISATTRLKVRVDPPWQESCMYLLPRNSFSFPFCK